MNPKIDVELPITTSFEPGSPTTPVIDAVPKPETPLARSQAAFLAELPELLVHHRGKWIAFADGRRVRLADSQTELYRHCLTDLGLTHDRFVVRRIVPESGPQIEYNLR